MTEHSDDTEHLEARIRQLYTERARSATPETLPALIEELMGHQHDYGSVCVAMGLAAAATAWAMNRHPGARGGITGFQGGAVMWEFLRAWDSSSIGKCGARLVNYDDMLYPQYASKFTTIPRRVLDSLRDEATRRLTEDGGEDEQYRASPEVRAHWETISLGQSPFGLEVSD